MIYFLDVTIFRRKFEHFSMKLSTYLEVEQDTPPKTKECKVRAMIYDLDT